MKNNNLIKLSLYFITIASSIGLALILLYLNILAMTQGQGLIILDFNYFNEGWIETGLLVVFAGIGIWVVRDLIRRQR